MNKPSIGRIVHCVDGTSHHLPAIVTNIWTESIDAYVFGDPAFDYPKFVCGVPYSDLPEPGTWHWPEREVSP